MVSREEAEALAKRYGIKYFETSALSNDNIDEAVMYLSKLVLESGSLGNQSGEELEVRRDKRKCCENF